MHTSHDTSTIGRFAPRSRTTKTPTFAYDIHSGVLVRQLLVALGGGTGRDQLPFRHGQPPDDCAFGWPAALSWLQAILAARVDAAQVVSPYSGQELQRVLLASARTRIGVERRALRVRRAAAFGGTGTAGSISPATPEERRYETMAS